MAGDSLDGSTSVVEAGLVQQQTFWRFPFVGGAGCQAHYWALRQQALRDPRLTRRGLPAASTGFFLVWTVAVVALLWWWGVVFDLWIVVASISTMRVRMLALVGWCSWVCCWC